VIKICQLNVSAWPIERRRGTANHNHRSDTITIVKKAVPRSPPSTIDQYPPPEDRQEHGRERLQDRLQSLGDRQELEAQLALE
jgi:hypothetical protein